MDFKNFALILSIILVIVLAGCFQVDESNEKKVYDEDLTKEDWDYFVFHYFSGKDLNQLFKSGFQIINTEMSKFDPINSSFLLEVNQSNWNELSNLKNISNIMYKNISNYRNELTNFTLSSNMIDHAKKQSDLFNVYENTSNLYMITYNRIVVVYNSSKAETSYVDISDIMLQIFSIEESINDIMDDQVNQILNIPDEIWNEWDDKDWSFMEESNEE